MTFQLEVHEAATGDAARVAYHLPTLPHGVSRVLYERIEAYTKAVRNGPDEAEDIAFAALKAHQATGLPDVIAKVVYQLHFEHRGLSDDGELIITESSDADSAAIELAITVLGELFSQVPHDWDAAMREYRATLLAEHDFDKRVWTPGYEAGVAGGKGNSPEVEAEIERLMDVRGAAESTLLDIPSETLEQFATKYLICFDCDRDMNSYEDMLLAEAKRLIGIPDDPARNYVEALLAVTEQRNEKDA